MNAPKDIVIIGAGVTGMALADYLCDSFTGRIRVFEASPTTGGRVKSHPRFGGTGQLITVKSYHTAVRDLLGRIHEGEEGTVEDEFFTDYNPYPELKSSETRWFDENGVLLPPDAVAGIAHLIDTWIPHLFERLELASFNPEAMTELQELFAEFSIEEVLLHNDQRLKDNGLLPADVPLASRRAFAVRCEIDNTVRESNALVEALMWYAEGAEGGYFGGSTDFPKESGAIIPSRLERRLKKRGVEIVTNCPVFLMNGADTEIRFLDGTTERPDLVLTTTGPRARGSILPFNTFNTGNGCFLQFEVNESYAKTLADPDVYSDAGQYWQHWIRPNTITGYYGGRAYSEMKHEGPFKALDAVFPGFSQNVVAYGGYDYPLDPWFGGAWSFPAPGVESIQTITEMLGRAKTHKVISVGEHLDLDSSGYVNGGVKNAKLIATILAERFNW